MASTIVAKYPASGKNQICLAAEEIILTTAVVSYGKNRVETITGTTPNGNATWKNLGYVTGGSTTETRTMEEVAAMGYRNLQQLIEIKFECNGTLELEYQNGRPLYYAIASNNGLGTPAQTAPGIAHSDAIGGVTGLNRHIIYEPELVSGAYTVNAVPELPSFNLIDGYTVAGGGQPKVVRKYLGCKVDTLGMTFNRDGSVKMTMGWKGSQVYSSQATTVANLLLSDFLSYEEVFPPVYGKVYLQSWTFPSSVQTWTSALDAALATSTYLLGDVTVASIDIANALEALFVIGDTTARAMVAQSRRYNGRMTIGFENESQHVQFLGELNNTYAADPTAKGDGIGTVSGSVLTDTGATWSTNELAGYYLTISNVDYLISSNTADTITTSSAPPSGSQNYRLNKGFGTWGMPWFVADRMKYYALKLFYDNSSLGYTTASANYRRIELTFLGVKFKSISSPRQVSGIIYQDYEWTALMLAPYNASDAVGGIVIYDAIASTDFHSTATGIV